MTFLTEDALVDILTDMDKLTAKPNKMYLNQNAIDLMTEDELALIQKDGLEALPEKRRKYLVKELMRRRCR